MSAPKGDVHQDKPEQKKHGHDLADRHESSFEVVQVHLSQQVQDDMVQYVKDELSHQKQAEKRGSKDPVDVQATDLFEQMKIGKQIDNLHNPKLSPAEQVLEQKLLKACLECEEDPERKAQLLKEFEKVPAEEMKKVMDAAWKDLYTNHKVDSIGMGLNMNGVYADLFKKLNHGAGLRELKLEE